MTVPPAETAHACDITLFVACYNEEQGVIASIETAVAAARQAGRSFDIVVVDDASSDRSVELVRQYMAQHPELTMTLLVNEKNQGLANNYAEAAFWGRGKYYRLICGDDVETQATLAGVFRRLGEADIITTYHAEAGARSPVRRLISRSYTTLINILGGHRLRYYNGVAVNLRYNVLRWHSNAYGFGFQADLLTRLLDMGATCLEIPVVPKERARGATKAFTLRNFCSVAHTLLEIVIRRAGKFMYPAVAMKLRHGVTVYRAAGPEPPAPPLR
jgi:glycosyltransferase involved in cell wall biosynthesis